MVGLYRQPTAEDHRRSRVNQRRAPVLRDRAGNSDLVQIFDRAEIVGQRSRVCRDQCGLVPIGRNAQIIGPNNGGTRLDGGLDRVARSVERDRAANAEIGGDHRYTLGFCTQVRNRCIGGGNVDVGISD